MSDDKARVSRVRRLATQRGFTLKRSPQRNASAIDYGLYAIFTIYPERLVSAPGPDSDYDMTLDKAEDWLNTYAHVP